MLTQLAASCFKPQERAYIVLVRTQAGETRILFDSGSQRTYVTNNVRKHLNLKTLRAEKVVINPIKDGLFHVRWMDGGGGKFTPPPPA